MRSLTKYQILETQIESTAEPIARGGKADVVRASFKRKDGAPSEPVAVKKLRCDDPKQFSKVKLFTSDIHSAVLMARSLGICS